tara:strand:- start:165 stop:272 length:108 start_codon:yes stop_codon:yes gene_type:complete
MGGLQSWRLGVLGSMKRFGVRLQAHPGDIIDEYGF